MDFELRETERKKDNSPEDRAAWLRLRLGLGQFEEGQLEFLALCGDAGAVSAGFLREPSFLARVAGLLEFGPRAALTALAIAAVEVSKTQGGLEAIYEFGVRVAMAVDAFESKGLAPVTWRPVDRSAVNIHGVVQQVQAAMEENIGAEVFGAAVQAVRGLDNIPRLEGELTAAVWTELRRWAENGGGRWRPEGHTQDPEPMTVGSEEGFAHMAPAIPTDEFSGDEVGEFGMSSFLSPDQLGPSFWLQRAEYLETEAKQARLHVQRMADEAEEEALKQQRNAEWNIEAEAQSDEAQFNEEVDARFNEEVDTEEED